MSSFADMTPISDGGYRGKHLNIWCDMLAAHDGELGRLRVGLFGAYGDWRNPNNYMCGMYIWDVELKMFACDSAPPPMTSHLPTGALFVRGNEVFRSSVLSGIYAKPIKPYMEKFRRFVAEANGYNDLTYAPPSLYWLTACGYRDAALP